MKKSLFVSLFVLVALNIHAQIILKDIFGRNLVTNGITLVDWEGYIANPAIKLSLTPPAGVSFPYSVTITANHSRLYFNTPSTTGAAGPAKTIVFNSATSKDFYISIFPDRGPGNESYTLNLSSSSGMQTFPIAVIDHDPVTPTINYNILVDFSKDKPAYNFFNNSQANKDIVVQAANDWAYFLSNMNFDPVAAGAEQTWIWEDDFSVGAWNTNANGYNGFLFYAYGIHTSPHRSGGAPSTHAFQKINGQTTNLRRSGGYEAEVHGNYNTLGYNNNITDNSWYLATNFGNVQNDLYSIALHETGHAINFNPGYPVFNTYKNQGFINHAAVVAYQGANVPVDQFDHLSNGQNTDTLKLVDRISKRGAFGSEYANVMPYGRWLISKVNLLSLQAIGYNLKMTTPFLPVSILTTGLPNGTTGLNYNMTVSSQGGVPFYNYEVLSGALPAGLTINTFNGQISGTPTIAGTSNFTIKVTDYDNQSATKAFSIQIDLAAPIANFTWSPNPANGCSPLSVTYNAFSTGGPAISYSWSFPGGTPTMSTVAEPSVTYSFAGSYSVSLTLGNASGSNSISQIDIVTISTVPATAFSGSANGLSASFTNSSTNATSYSWDFGDGQASTEANPAHTYATDGVYTVVLTSANACGNSTATQGVTVSTAPTASFTASTASGCAPLSVQFTSTASANTTTWNWSFPGGQPATSTAQNPTVVYITPGTYSVELTAANTAGSNTATQLNSVTVGTVPATAFSGSANGLSASFTNTSANATSYSWDFGDGQASTEANPTHTYATDGVYTVVLTSTNACGNSTATQGVVIETVANQDLSIVKKFTIYPNPNSGNFEVEISGIPMQNVKLELVNAIGIVVGEAEYSFQTGYLKKNLDFGKLPSGFYNIQVRLGHQSVFKKIIIQ